MTAAAARTLYDRAMRPRPSHDTPELNAALLTLADESIAAANDYAEGMIEQGHLALATFGYVLKAEFAQGRDVLVGMMEREENNDGED